MIRNWLLTILIVFVFSLPAAAPALADSLSDVNPEDYHYVAISWLYENGLIDGYEDGTFRADDKINRAEALKLLTLASGVFSEEEFENTEISEDPFSDTPADSWYAKYLFAAKEKGIINGYDDGSFKPEANINLAEALKIYLESLGDIGYPSSEDLLFADTPEDAWFTKYTSYAAFWNMLEIHPTNEIYPDQEISRGYLAEIIYRHKQAGNEGYRFGKATYYGSAAQGSPTASGITFDKDAFTAAHKTLPFGTIVEVTNLANGKSVNVQITDRGPYGPGRVLDLSSGAFSQIGELSSGVINVQFRVVPEETLQEESEPDQNEITEE